MDSQQGESDGRASRPGGQDQRPLMGMGGGLAHLGLIEGGVFRTVHPDTVGRLHQVVTQVGIARLGERGVLGLEVPGRFVEAVLIVQIVGAIDPVEQVGIGRIPIIERVIPRPELQRIDAARAEAPARRRGQSARAVMAAVGGEGGAGGRSRRPAGRAEAGAPASRRGCPSSGARR